MVYIKRLPFILALFLTIIVGLVSYNRQIDIQQVYLRMAICLGSFLTVGVFYKKVVNQLELEIESYKNKKKEDNDGPEKDTVNLKKENKISNTGGGEEADKGTESNVHDSDEFSPWNLNGIINFSEQKKK